MSPPIAIFYAAAGAAICCVKFNGGIKKTILVAATVGGIQWLVAPDARPLTAFAVGLIAPVATQLILLYGTALILSSFYNNFWKS